MTSAASRPRYRTIVADPPWRQAAGPTGWDGRGNDTRVARLFGVKKASRSAPLAYPTMTVAEIAALPVADWAADDAHLYLWVTNRYIEASYGVARAWGFAPVTLLTWCKPPKGMGLGGAFVQTTEHCLFARRGRDVRQSRSDSTWHLWRRPGDVNRVSSHSAKPEAFLDLVEQVSPTPRLELFARRNRLGWDTWGDEALGGTELLA